MDSLKQPKFWIRLGVAVVALLIVQQFWKWEIERVEVPAGKFLVQVHRWGNDLPENDVVAQDDSFKGIMLEPLAEGRHFLNPIFWGYEVHEMVQVPAGKCLVRTRNYGRPIPAERLAQGDILAGDGERGIVEEWWGPGNYRINPYAYKYEIFEAVHVRDNQVGVRTRKVGKDPTDLPVAKEPGKPLGEHGRGSYVVPAGYWGVQKDLVPPGPYYINPYVETITPVDVRAHQVELTDIEFPSGDGFLLHPHVRVEYAVQQDMAPEVLVRLTDEGKLHQDDATPEQQKQNEILQKVILPHIRGYARIEGSNFSAKDFIITNPAEVDQKAINNREKLQRNLLAKVKPRCRDLGIDIRAVTMANIPLPEELSTQIADRQLALVKQKNNQAQVKQLKTKQDLKAAEALVQQSQEKVKAETRVSVAKTKAEQMVEVEKLKLTQDLANSQVRLDAAKKEAEATLSRGKADAVVINLQNEAEVAGLKKAIQGFANVQNFAQYQMLKKLGPALTEIFASDDGDFARIFADFMAPSTNTAAKPPAPVAGGK